MNVVRLGIPQCRTIKCQTIIELFFELVYGWLNWGTARKRLSISLRQVYGVKVVLKY